MLAPSISDTPRCLFYNRLSFRIHCPILSGSLPYSGPRCPPLSSVFLHPRSVTPKERERSSLTRVGDHTPATASSTHGCCVCLCLSVHRLFSALRLPCSSCRCIYFGTWLLLQLLLFSGHTFAPHTIKKSKLVSGKATVLQSVALIQSMSSISPVYDPCWLVTSTLIMLYIYTYIHPLIY